MKKENKLDFCSECNKKLRELESNPYGLCDKCFGKIAEAADLSVFDEI